MIQKREIEREYQSCANFVKSQMDAPEQFLLFYNSFCYPKSKTLLIKYGMLDTLQVGHLISPDHNVIREFKLIQ